MERLNPRVQLLWAVVVLLAAAILGGIIAAVARFGFHRDPVLGLVGFGVVIGLGILHTILRFRIWQFDLQEDALFLERGVVTRVRTVVPFVRIQHVDTQRSPGERILGLSSVVVYTAGSRGADVSIPGLKPDRARELQQQLRALVGEREGDDAV